MGDTAARRLSGRQMTGQFGQVHDDMLAVQAVLRARAARRARLGVAAAVVATVAAAVWYLVTS